MKITKRRLIWLIPNVYCYLMFIGVALFITIYFEGLQEINRLGIWLVAMILLLTVSVHGSYTILKWMREGKL
ncbi:hypothetical protein [Rossellomorea sp. YZS02]|uniref:hypothetical protein n=1 Tax=Rossellomorea sp. YZS02 TaxID=3097358 RepID=UPI002A14B741|nr:hypothetical protein [Rossellomorea sp. YZS02]MDX8342486.1 hypothetical protein [Rossellomorea sp. YZS02]